MGQAQPGSFTLNAPTGAVTANATIVPAGGGGQIAVLATNPTELIIDVIGYFAPLGACSLDFLAARPAALRTLASMQAPSAVRCWPPEWRERSRFLSRPERCRQQSEPTRSTLQSCRQIRSSLTLWGSGARPGSSTLNAGDGTVTSNAAIIPAGASGEVTAIASNDTHLITGIN